MTKGYRSQPRVLDDDTRPLHGGSTLVGVRAVEEIMRPDTRSETRLHADEAQALRWLKRRLEWEEILAALRDSGDGTLREPAPQRREPAAA